MPDNGPNQSATVWPLPKFYFVVQFGSGDPVPFQEVSGLDVDSSVLEYHHGNSPAFSTIKMPGLAKIGNVTMKKGIFPADNVFWTWFSGITMNTIKRETVIISLLDEAGAPAMVWTLINAWPTKVTGTDLKSDGREVAVESIEIAHEGMMIRSV